MPSLSSHLRRHGRLAAVTAVAVIASATTAAAATPDARPSTPPAPGMVDAIVQMQPGVAPATARAAVARHDGRVTGTLTIINGLAVRLPQRDLAGLRHEAGVRAVTPNRPARAQGEMVSTRSLKTAYPYTLRAPYVWNYSPSYRAETGRGVAVAVIDSGIAGGIPDFRRSYGDAGSRVVASVVTNPNATNAADTYGHGTHVAGIIAGNGNLRSGPLNGNYVGIAPAADLVSVKVSDDQGRATVLDVIYGLQFVVDKQSELNIRVVNLSLTSTTTGAPSEDPLNAAVEEAWNRGIVVVAAAGNRGASDTAMQYAPGNDPYVITVGALDDQGTTTRDDDAAASWSSRGVTQDGVAKPEVYAPGSQIVSTLAPGSEFASQCPSCVVSDAYIQAGGTSMAAPMVSGTVALMLERRPWLTPNQVKGILMSTTRTLPGGEPAISGYGAVYTNVTAQANDGLTPHTMIDRATGSIDPAWSSWSRSSWSSAAPFLTADWSRSSWSCNCSRTGSGDVDPSWSSWSWSSWSTSWTK